MRSMGRKQRQIFLMRTDLHRWLDSHLPEVLPQELWCSYFWKTMPITGNVRGWHQAGNRQETKKTTGQKACDIINLGKSDNRGLSAWISRYSNALIFYENTKNQHRGNLTYALHIWNCLHVSEFKSENSTTTTYWGQSGFRLSGCRKGLRALCCELP